MHLPDPKERHPFVSAPLRWNALFKLLRIGLCRAANTVLLALFGRSALGVSECVWSGPDWFLKQPSIYTAGARPILLFFQSKTEKYNLRKISPRTQVSDPLMPSGFPRMWVKQTCSEAWGRQKYTPVSLRPYLSLPSTFRAGSFFLLFPSFIENQVGLSTAFCRCRNGGPSQNKRAQVDWFS